MSVTVHLVRHAIKEKATGDVPITSKGILQAKATALYFAEIPSLLSLRVRSEERLRQRNT